jgi:hypothetical protein
VAFGDKQITTTPMKNSLKLFAAIAVLSILSCNKSSTNDIMPAAMQKESAAGAKDKQEIPDPRKIIKEGEISFESKDAAETKSMVSKTVSELGGYISKDDAHEYSSRFEHHLIVRIPANKFDDLLQRISKEVPAFDNMNVDVLDVTDKYIDIAARIKTKKELQARYQEILKTATKVEEILSIEKEIGELQTDIESVEGQMKLLNDKIIYSTLDITFYQKNFAFYGFLSKSRDAVKTGWNYFLAFIIIMIHLWPFILLFILSLYLIKRQRRGKKLSL